MKSFSLLLLLFIASVGANATIRTVSNVASLPGQFTTINLAQTASSNGDTIMVYPSATGYSTPTMSKRLTIIGTGPNPSHLLSNVTSVSGVAFTTGGKQCRFIGITFTSTVAITSADSTEFHQCKFANSAVNFTTSNFVLFRGCWLNGTSNVISMDANSSGVLFLNCFMDFTTTSSGATFFSGTSTMNPVYFQNCIFSAVRNTSPVNNFFNASTAFVNCVNCIFYNTHGSLATSSSYENCLSFCNGITLNAFNSGTGNTSTNCIENTNPNFTSFPTAGAAYSTSHDFTLQAGSPGENAGVDGTDLGLFGGQSGAFDTQFNPGIPVVKTFSLNTPVIPQGSNLIFNSKGKKQY